MNERSAEYKAYIEDFLKSWYARFHDEPQKELFEAMEYSLLAGGKRLRPYFAFEFCRLCGTDCLNVSRRSKKFPSGSPHEPQGLWRSYGCPCR